MFGKTYMAPQAKEKTNRILDNTLTIDQKFNFEYLGLLEAEKQLKGRLKEFTKELSTVNVSNDFEYFTSLSKDIQTVGNDINEINKRINSIPVVNEVEESEPKGNADLTDYHRGAF